MNKLTEMQIMKIVGEFEKLAGEEQDEFEKPCDDVNKFDEMLKHNIMFSLEQKLQGLFQNSTNTLKQYYAFMFNELYYKLQLSKQPGYPFYTCHVIKMRDKWDQKGEKELLSEFIFKNCNPEGALLIEQLMFEAIT